MLELVACVAVPQRFDSKTSQLSPTRHVPAKDGQPDQLLLEIRGREGPGGFCEPGRGCFGSARRQCRDEGRSDGGSQVFGRGITAGAEAVTTGASSGAEATDKLMGDISKEANKLKGRVGGS